MRPLKPTVLVFEGTCCSGKTTAIKTLQHWLSEVHHVQSEIIDGYWENNFAEIAQQKLQAGIVPIFDREPKTQFQKPDPKQLQHALIFLMTTDYATATQRHNQSGKPRSGVTPKKFAEQLEAYFFYQETHPSRVMIIDAQQPQDVVFAEIANTIEDRLCKK